MHAAQLDGVRVSWKLVAIALAVILAVVLAYVALVLTGITDFAFSLL